VFVYTQVSAPPMPTFRRGMSRRPTPRGGSHYTRLGRRGADPGR
jgi:hypothetical protein